MLNNNKYDKLLERINQLEHNLSHEITKQKNQIDFTEIHAEDVLPLAKFDKNSLKYADMALNNEIVPFPGFDTIEFTSHFDWTYIHHKNHVSYQLYLQSLRVVGQILATYNKRNDKKYLLKAKEITESWMSFVEAGQQTDMTWYDHPVGNRTQILVHLLYELQQANVKFDQERYLQVLYKHADYLLEDENYRKNNHGIMVDRGLMMLGYVTKDRFLFNKGYYRVIDTFWQSFSYKGGHLENSPEYHNMVLRMYVAIEEYLNKHDDSLGDDVVKHMEAADQYLNVLLKPNKRLPAIGDSGHTSLPERTPIWKNLVDEEAGIAVIKQNSDNKIYLSFVCGYSTITHKHSDDLSITLNVNGIDFIDDAGKFDYSKSKIRRFVVTPKAHSSLQIENKFYKKQTDNNYTQKIWIEKHFDHDDYFLVKGRNYGFDDGTQLHRTIVFLKKEETFIIMDESASKDEKTFISNFNLQHEVKITEAEAFIQLIRNDQSVFIRSFDNISPVIVNGSLDPVEAVNATGPSKHQLTKHLQYKQTGQAVTQILSIGLSQDAVRDISVEGSYLHVRSVSGKTVIPL